MRYVLLGALAAGAMKKQTSRMSNARAKLKQLGVRLESVHYTQGPFDFVDVVDAPSAEAMLAFSVWYAEQGYGKVVTCPAFEEREMVKALHRAGVRGAPPKPARAKR